MHLIASAILVAPMATSAQILPPAPARPQLDSNGVDLFSQKVTYSVPLLSIGPKDHRGLNYTLYRSGDAFRTTFDTGLKVNLSITDNSKVVTIGNHSESFFTASASEELALGALIDGNVYYDRYGTKTDLSYLVAASVDSNDYLANYTEHPDGTRIDYHYKTASGGGDSYTRIQSVTTNTGWQIKYNYAANTMTSSPSSVGPWRQVTSVVAINNAIEYCDPDADTCTLVGSWPQAQYLSAPTWQVVDATGGMTEIDFSSTYFKVKTADSPTYNLLYTISSRTTPFGAQNRVTQANINGLITNYNESFSGFNQTLITSAPLSQNFTYTADARYAAITSVVDPLSRTTTYAYDANLRLTQITPPEGDYRYFTYINSGGRTPRGIIGEAGHAVKTGSSGVALYSGWGYEYSCTSQTLKYCNSPLEYTDMKGSWSYDYSSAHGGLVRSTSSVNRSYLRTVIRYGYEQRYAWIKDASGNPVHAGGPIYVRTTEKSCRTSNTDPTTGACAAGPSDETVTEYDYGPDSLPNNLLVRGKTVTANGVSLRTCYGYDNLGNKISETTPNAGLGSCP